jgi:hypothetical protein
MSFKRYLDTIEGPGVVYTFGRFNPPFTNGHYENFQFLQKYAKKYKMDAIIFTSSTQNEKKNPLNFNDKVKFLQLGAPKGVQVSKEPNLKNSYQILEDLIKNKKYQRIVFVVGEDRVNDFKSMKKYAEQWGEEMGFRVDFKVVESGKRKPGVSGTSMRNFAKDNDFESFKKGLAPSLRKYAEEIFIKTRQGLGYV